MTIVNFDGKSYVEADASNPVMTEFVCECGNVMNIPLGAIELGITTDCGHCTVEHGYPKNIHCSAITSGWIGLLEDEEVVDL